MLLDSPNVKVKTGGGGSVSPLGMGSRSHRPHVPAGEKSPPRSSKDHHHKQQQQHNNKPPKDVVTMRPIPVAVGGGETTRETAAAAAAALDGDAPSVFSDFTNRTESMTTLSRSLYKASKSKTKSSRTLTSCPTPQTPPPQSSQQSPLLETQLEEEKDADLDLAATPFLAEYNVEDLFKLLQAQQTITNSFLDITTGMAGIVDKYEQKRIQKEGESFAAHGASAAAAAAAAARSSTRTKSERIMAVVESMAQRHEKLSTKVVSVAVHAMQQVHEKELQRSRLERRVKELEDYIASKRKPHSTTAATATDQSTTTTTSTTPDKQHAPPVTTVITRKSTPSRPPRCTPPQRHIGKRSTSLNGLGAVEFINHNNNNISSNQQKDCDRNCQCNHHDSSAGGADEMPPGFSGVLELKSTTIDICELHKSDDVDSVVPSLADSCSVRIML